MKLTLRPITFDDIRRMCIAEQGWDPGDGDPSKLRPISPEEKTRPFFRAIQTIKEDDEAKRLASE